MIDVVLHGGSFVIGMVDLTAGSHLEHLLIVNKVHPKDSIVCLSTVFQLILCVVSPVDRVVVAPSTVPLTIVAEVLELHELQVFIFMHELFGC